MRALVIYETLTGNTKTASFQIAAQLEAEGVSTVVSPINKIDLQALSEADVVLVGSWTDGIFFFGQRPGRASRITKNLPRIDGKKSVVFCTYALDCGSTLEKLKRIVANAGGDVVGGFAIRRDDLAGGAGELVKRLLGALESS